MRLGAVEEGCRISIQKCPRIFHATVMLDDAAAPLAYAWHFVIESLVQWLRSLLRSDDSLSLVPLCTNDRLRIGGLSGTHDTGASVLGPQRTQRRTFVLGAASCRTSNLT